MSDQPTDLEDLAERLWGSTDDDDSPVMSASELSRASFLAFAGPSGEVEGWTDAFPIAGVPRLDLRLHGSAISGHSAPVRLATRALTIVQDLVSVVGMAQRGKKSLSGAIPAAILRATELNLNPAASPGSLVFELRGTRPEIHPDQNPALDSKQTLADTAASEIFSLLGSAESGEGTAVLRELQRLGPRVATHFRRLSALTLSESLLLDMRWQQGDGRLIYGQIHAAGATELERVIAKSRTTLEPKQLHGHLVTISTEDKLVLRDEVGKRIPLVESERFAQDPALFYDKDVVAEVELEIEQHPSTGRDTKTYHLVSLALSSQGVSPTAPSSLDM